jgi:hypothetical protein
MIDVEKVDFFCNPVSGDKEYARISGPRKASEIELFRQVWVKYGMVWYGYLFRSDIHCTHIVNFLHRHVTQHFEFFIKFFIALFANNWIRWHVWHSFEISPTPSAKSKDCGCIGVEYHGTPHENGMYRVHMRVRIECAIFLWIYRSITKWHMRIYLRQPWQSPKNHQQAWQLQLKIGCCEKKPLWRKNNHKFNKRIAGIQGQRHYFFTILKVVL